MTSRLNLEAEKGYLSSRRGGIAGHIYVKYEHSAAFLRVDIAGNMHPVMTEHKCPRKGTHYKGIDDNVGSSTWITWNSLYFEFKDDTDWFAIVILGSMFRVECIAGELLVKEYSSNI